MIDDNISEHLLVEVKPFHTNVNVVIGKTINQGLEYCNEFCEKDGIFELEKEEENVGGLYYVSNCDKHFILLSINSDIQDIVHESFHAVMRIAHDRGAEWSFSSDEFYAYSIGQFVSEVSKFLEEFKNKHEDKSKL